MTFVPAKVGVEESIENGITDYELFKPNLTYCVLSVFIFTAQTDSSTPTLRIIFTKIAPFACTFFS
jgi:hypothetical protein